MEGIRQAVGTQTCHHSLHRVLRAIFYGSSALETSERIWKGTGSSQLDFHILAHAFCFEIKILMG